VVPSVSAINAGSVVPFRGALAPRVPAEAGVPSRMGCTGGRRSLAWRYLNERTTKWQRTNGSLPAISGEV